jgi:type I restriction enzyme S subunit
MIDGFKPYPQMKDSGVPWLGEVPLHWEVQTVGRLGQLFKGNGASKADEVDVGVPCVRYGDLYTQHEFFIATTKACVTPDRASAYTPIRFGDLLFAASGETDEDIGRSAVNLLQADARCGGDVLVLRPSREFVPRFLGYAANSPASRVQKATMGRGFTVVHIYGAQLRHLALAVPPLPEQATIVRLLDHADRRIRRYIRAKQKLIKLLEEQKQAIVHRAVTRGLDPNVRLKPSGVEWLGDVPEHWEMRRNGRLFAQRNETGFGGLPILEVSLRTGVRVRDFENSDRKQVMADREKYKRAVAGDIAYNMMRMWQGAVGVAPVDGLISPAYVVARPLPGTEPRYFEYLFRLPAYMGEVDKYSRGIVKDRNRLYWEDFKQIPSCCPPYSEQVAISDAIAQLTVGIDAANDRVRREIALLLEYRTRLIADVVTGKLDVREAAARLPEEAEEPEPLDEAEVVVHAEESDASDGDGTPEEVEA